MNSAQIKQYLLNNIIWGENGTPKVSRPYYATIPLVMPDTSKAWGIDGSHWNLPPMAIRRMKDEFGMSFAIFKGCDGSVSSRYYNEHKQAAKDAGIPWGMYVWLYPNSKVSIEAQVNAWHARFISDPPPMGLFIDAEWTNYMGSPANPSAADLRMAHDKWHTKSGQKATTYTARGYADQYLRGFDFNREDLWVASYGGTRPLMPTGSDRWTFWQFTSTLDGHRLDPNGNAELDGNYFYGTPTEFHARYGGTQPPQEPEEPMHNYFKVNTAVLNIRAAANGVDLGDFNLLRDDIVEAGNAISGWRQIFKIWRGGQVVPFVHSPTGQYWASGAYMVATTFTPPQPPAAGLPDEVYIGTTRENVALYRKVA